MDEEIGKFVEDSELPLSDWYIRVSGDGESPYNSHHVGGFTIEIRMNHEDRVFYGLMIEGVKCDDGVLELSIITPNDERLLVRSTVSGNPDPGWTGGGPSLGLPH